MLLIEYPNPNPSPNPNHIPNPNPNPNPIPNPNPNPKTNPNPNPNPNPNQVPLTEYVFERGSLWLWARDGDATLGAGAGAASVGVSCGAPSHASAGGLRECRRVPPLEEDADGVASLCFEQAVGGKEVLVFCATKQMAVSTRP